MSDDPSAPRRAPRVGVVIAALLGLLLCCGAIPAVGVVAAIAVPNFVAMQVKSKRAEVPGFVDGIRVAQIAFEGTYGTFVPVGSRAEAERELAQHGGKALRPWSGGKDWETLGWYPGSSVRGAYWVEVSADGRDFIVHGLCDVDGDGRYAEYQASSERTATAVTPPDVY